MSLDDDIAYAVNCTRVVLEPKQTLETFGSTCIRYHLISELMDAAGKVRVRTGKVYSERPQIITPGDFADSLLSGFGAQARDYAQWLQTHGELMKILRYGLQFRKDQAEQEVIQGDLKAVSDRVRESVESDQAHLNAVLVGADELWEVSLLKFVVDFVRQSVPANLEALNQRAREEDSARSRKVRADIEREFHAAQQQPERIPVLGNKLEKYGLFGEYEDRFYGLLRRR